MMKNYYLKLLLMMYGLSIIFTSCVSTIYQIDEVYVEVLDADEVSIFNSVIKPDKLPYILKKWEIPRESTIKLVMKEIKDMDIYSRIFKILYNAGYLRVIIVGEKHAEGKVEH